VCTDTKIIYNESWVGKAKLCSRCGDNEVQERDIVITSEKYPYVRDVICLKIPSPGNSVIWKLGEDNYTVTHTTTSINCNGRVENYHLIGPKISWWEAVEICEKLGRYMPINRDSLLDENVCGGIPRWQLLKTALYGVISIPYVWTQEDGGNNRNVWRVNLNNGETTYSWRYSSTNISNGRVLCGPKI
jgi:hypothetical protein